MAAEKLKCPKCVGILETKEYGRQEGHPISVDVCWACSGIWFDKGELEQALKLKFKIEQVAPTWKNPKFDEFKKKDAKCPRCKVELLSIPTRQDSRLTKDVCPKCYGTWLDGGELADLERGGVVHRVLQSLKERYEEWREDHSGQ